MYRAFLSACFMLLLCYCSSCTYERCVDNMKKAVLPEAYSGVVDSNYIDHADYESPVLLLKNGRKVHLNYYPDSAFYAIHPGDSVIKLRDSACIKAFRWNGRTFIFYPECNGREVRELL